MKGARDSLRLRAGKDEVSMTSSARTGAGSSHSRHLHSETASVSELCLRFERSPACEIIPVLGEIDSQSLTPARALRASFTTARH